MLVSIHELQVSRLQKKPTQQTSGNTQTFGRTMLGKAEEKQRNDTRQKEMRREGQEVPAFDRTLQAKPEKARRDVPQLCPFVL